MDNSPQTATPTRPLRRIVVVAVVAVAVVAAYLGLGGDRLIERLGEHEAQLIAFRNSRPILVYAGALVVYTILAALLPVATGLTLAYGWFFGFAGALVLISFASTAAATLTMLISRYALRDVLSHRFGVQLSRVNDALEREGAFYLFAARLIPVVPFFVINVVMGLTSMRVSTFWWVSQLGMLAGTAVYVFAGSRFPSFDKLASEGALGVLEPGMFVAFVMLGVFPLLVKKLIDRIRARFDTTTST